MITQERLKELLDYNPDTGGFVWRAGMNKGKVAGYVKRKDSGPSYRIITVNGEQYRAHRLAWYFVHGEWPKHTIDHINGDGLDNRIANLRDVPHVENQRNRNVSKANKNGIMGVWWNARAKSWQVSISGQTLEYYKDFFEACCARRSAENKLGYHVDHGKRIV